ncbi:MAG: hypothetical protein HRK26_00345 [Rickettsiaceae bacterium H1]|nr:hypothetical protein [Rickettsiaceae bacterium H1]
MAVPTSNYKRRSKTIFTKKRRFKEKEKLQHSLKEELKKVRISVIAYSDLSR